MPVGATEMRRVTFWLLPEAALATELAGVMEAVRHSGVGAFREALHPSFAPHVTLGSAALPDDLDVAHLLVEVGRRHGPQRLAVAGTLSAPDPEDEDWTLWRSLALDLVPSASLLALTAGLAHRLDADLVTPEIPHISLHYSRLGRTAKLRLLEQLGPPDLVHRWPSMGFDRVAVVEERTARDDELERLAGWIPKHVTPLLGTPTHIPA